VTSDTARGDKLIEHILTVGDTGGQVSNDLIGEFYTHGYPVEKLIPLLRSDDDETVKTGAFLAEELGTKAAPLMPELMRLLGHQDRNVRYDILDAVLVAASSSDGEVIARAITLMTDPDRAVRSKALNFLARADREQLVAGLPHVADREVSAGLGWLVEVEKSAVDEEVVSRLGDEDRLVRWFAAVAAARAFRRSPDPLNRAAESSDEELRAFAESQQQRFQRERSRRK
jgi:HEAT repeat protein